MKVIKLVSAHSFGKNVSYANLIAGTVGFVLCLWTPLFFLYLGGQDSFVWQSIAVLAGSYLVFLLCFLSRIRAKVFDQFDGALPISFSRSVVKKTADLPEVDYLSIEEECFHDASWRQIRPTSVAEVLSEQNFLCYLILSLIVRTPDRALLSAMSLRSDVDALWTCLSVYPRTDLQYAYVILPTEAQLETTLSKELIVETYESKVASMHKGSEFTLSIVLLSLALAHFDKPLWAFFIFILGILNHLPTLLLVWSDCLKKLGDYKIRDSQRWN
jgi:hypothetical protein